MFILWFYAVMLSLCAYSGYLTNGALLAAQKRRCKELAGMLRLMSVGIRLSAVGYAFRLIDYSQPGVLAQVSSICSLAGSLVLWLAWFRLPRVMSERAKLSTESGDEGRDIVPETFSQEFGLHGSASTKPLSVLAYQVLGSAQELAKSQCIGEIEADHILRCLLEGPRGAGKLIVNDLLSENKDVRSRFKELYLRQLDVSHNAGGNPLGAVSSISAVCVPMKLSERAKQVLTFAGLEARRFDCEYIGTEHLLLGLLLMGAGDGVIALFQKGVTVDAVRSRVIRNRSIARAAQ